MYRIPSIRREFMASGRTEDKQNLTLFKSGENPKNRDIADFAGRNLIIGCGDCKKACCAKHPAKDFYSIDIDSNVSPDLCLDITKPIPADLLPDKRFDFIYFENIDLSCFIDDKNNPKLETFKNIYRLLSDDGVCAIATAPLAFLSLGKYKSHKYKGNYFSSTILCEHACQTEPFKAGKIYKADISGLDGGLLIVRKSNIDEDEAFQKLNESAQFILKSEFIDKEKAVYTAQRRY
ncbi:MAG: hypothetical protein ACYCQI_11215 [Gammaproteobacteria bacterium]